MDRYQKTEKGTGGIGEGAYGVVYKGKDKKTGKTVAMKVGHSELSSNPCGNLSPSPDSSCCGENRPADG